ncbi:hypothetical protein GWK47_018365 [Chionoecetes opilio]|uniref:Uncharacterized protein n=1 Tax=Chionoecetes opilio TaxID=41210 RepID=A0A8J4XQS9_CHIOP|nr:hypothetical protein GWK47_018365 [Chionoecetes opilio]
MYTGLEKGSLSPRGPSQARHGRFQPLKKGWAFTTRPTREPPTPDELPPTLLTTGYTLQEGRAVLTPATRGALQGGLGVLKRPAGWRGRRPEGEVPGLGASTARGMACPHRAKITLCRPTGGVCSGQLPPPPVTFLSLGP